MGNILLTLAILLSVLFSGACFGHSGFTPQDFSLAQDYPFVSNNPYLATVYAECKAAEFEHRNRVSSKTERVPASFTRTGKMPVKIHLEKKHGKVVDQPIVFFIPASFQNLNFQVISVFVNNIKKAGNHVVVLPNPWSNDFIGEAPQFRPGNFELEATALKELITTIYQDISQTHQIHPKARIAGLSIGGFLAAMIVGMDAQSSRPFLEDASLFSPPFDLTESMNRFDSYFDEQVDEFGAMPLSSVYFRFMFACQSFETYIFDEKVNHDARGMASHLAFHWGMETMLEKLDQVYGEHNVRGKTQWGFVDQERKEWRKQLRLRGILMRTPALVDFIQSEKSNLRYWSKINSDFNPERIRILTNADDFINAANTPWHELGPHVMSLPTGGHMGYWTSVWFENFLAEIFK